MAMYSAVLAGSGDPYANRLLLEGLPPKNAAAKAELLHGYQQQFGGWAFELQEGFSLLMYGFGSKQVPSEISRAWPSIEDGNTKPYILSKTSFHNKIEFETP